jgi:hypothetical protein
LTAAGSILQGAGLVSAPTVDLVASAGSIGVAATPLLTATPTLKTSAATNTYASNDESTTITATGGNGDTVSIATTAGNLTSEGIGAGANTLGNATLTAAGNILQGSGVVAATAVDLIATAGSIGAPATPLVVDPATLTTHSGMNTFVVNNATAPLTLAATAGSGATVSVTTGGDLTAGVSASSGTLNEVDLTATTGNLSDTALIGAATIKLTAGGSIGTSATAPFAVDAATLTTSSGADTYVTDGQSVALNVIKAGTADVTTTSGDITSDGVGATVAKLTAAGNILQGTGSVTAGTITLTAMGGAIGASGSALAIDTNPTPPNNGSLTTASKTNTFVADSSTSPLALMSATGGNGDTISVTTKGDLVVGSGTSSKDATGISASSGDTLATVDLSAANISSGLMNNTFNAPKLAIIADTITLNAGGGTVGSGASPLGLAGNSIKITAGNSGQSAIAASNAQGSIGQNTAFSYPSVTTSGQVNVLFVPWTPPTPVVIGAPSTATPFEASTLANGSQNNTTAGTTGKSLQFDVAQAANSLVSLFDLVEPRVCLPPDQLEEDSPNGKGCGSTTRAGTKSAAVEVRQPPISRAVPKTPDVATHDAGE